MYSVSRRTHVVSVFFVSAVIITAIWMMVTGSQTAVAQEPDRQAMLIPIGGGYSDTYAGLMNAAIANAKNGVVEILVLPLSLSTDPFTIGEVERQTSLNTAENRRFEIEEACKRSAPTGVSCSVTLVPVLVREDALEETNLSYFNRDLSTIFILDGNQSIAVQVMGGTPVEQALFEAYDHGVIIAGTGAGGNLLSTAMIAGYQPGFSARNVMDFDAVDVWYTAEKHGLIFGIQNAILEQHFYQEGRLGRLLNAISLPDSPHTGIGIDAYTGVHITGDSHLDDVFGLYTVTILDAETYHAAHNVQYHGPNYAISMRNVVVHLIPSGEFAFDLDSKSFTSFAQADQPQAPALRIARSYTGLSVPSGTGTLMLSSNPDMDHEQNPVFDHFIELSGGDPDRILILADGYPDLSSAEEAVQKIQTALGGRPPSIVIDPTNAQNQQTPDPSTYDAVLFIGGDQSLLHIDRTSKWLKEAWLSGKPILAENAAAAAIGVSYTAHGRTPIEGGEREIATQKSFILGGTNIRTGLGLLKVNIEPGILADNRWGRFFSLAYHHPDTLSVGIAENTAMIISHDGGVALGENVLFVLDLSQASLAEGSNRAFAIANGLLDVFAAGEAIHARDASTIASYTRAATPSIPTPTMTLAPTATPIPTQTPLPPTPDPTRTPRPTPTPVVVPPASNPGTTHTLAISGVLVVLVIIFGLWLNRRRVF
jgi:cyanophycinase